MLEDICEWKQDQQRNTKVIHDVGGENDGAEFIQLGEEKAKRDIIAYLLLPIGWLQRTEGHILLSQRCTGATDVVHSKENSNYI